jgi:hypothetical protein
VLVRKVTKRVKIALSTNPCVLRDCPHLFERIKPINPALSALQNAQGDVKKTK